MGRLTSNGMIQPLNTSADHKDGFTYVCWIDTNGNQFIGQHNHTTNVWSTFILATGWEVDNHNSAGVLVRPDGRILTVYMGHNTHTARRRISTNPHDITSWEAESSLASLGFTGPFTYPNLLDLAGESDKIYLFYRVNTAPGRRHFSTSTDGGVTWAAPTELLRNDPERPYLQMCRNGSSRIDFVATDGNVEEVTTNNVYHFYYQGGQYFKSDGTEITQLPFEPVDLTQIYDGSVNKADHGLEIAVGSDNHPRILFIAGGVARYARWNGAAWVTNEVTF